MKPLYKIDSELEELLNQGFEYAKNNDGLFPADIQNKIDHLRMEKKEKVGNYGRAIKNIDSEMKLVKVEIDILENRYRRLKNNLEYIKKRLIDSLSIDDERETYRDGAVDIVWRKSTKLLITDLAQVPDCYCRKKKFPNKQLIKKRLDAGENIAGVEKKSIFSIKIK